MLEHLLGRLGLSPKEITVYLTIVEDGKISHADVSKKTAIKRSTVYSIIQGLVQKGLIGLDQSSNPSYLFPLPLRQLREVVEQEEKQLETKKRVIEEIGKSLDEMQKNKNYSVPKMRFVDEKHMRDFLFTEGEKWLTSHDPERKHWWGFQDHSFAEHYEDWIDWTWKMMDSDARVHIFSNTSTVEKRLKKTKSYANRRNIFFWQKKTKFTGSLWVIGDDIALVMTRQRPHYMVVIHDEVLTHNVREFFKNVWREMVDDTV